MEAVSKIKLMKEYTDIVHGSSPNVGELSLICGWKRKTASRGRSERHESRIKVKNPEKIEYIPELEGAIKYFEQAGVEPVITGPMSFDVESPAFSPRKLKILVSYTEYFDLVEFYMYEDVPYSDEKADEVKAFTSELNLFIPIGATAFSDDYGFTLTYSLPSKSVAAVDLDVCFKALFELYDEYKKLVSSIESGVDPDDVSSELVMFEFDTYLRQ